MTPRLSLPNRRNHISRKVRVADQRTLYLSVHDDVQPAEIFLRVKGSDCSSELIGLYDGVARLLSIPPKGPPEKIGDLLSGAKSVPSVGICRLNDGGRRPVQTMNRSKNDEPREIDRQPCESAAVPYRAPTD